MKRHSVSIVILLLVLISSFSQAQEMQTLFKGARSSGGYAALSNKFTAIDGEYANMVELYGGWFINKRFLLGVGGAATTNYIDVPEEFSTLPGASMSYGYGQFGLVTEYVFGSNKAVHLNFTMLSGAGFTFQYMRPRWNEWDTYDHVDNYDSDENFFFVIEPGVQLEMNVFKWMRFSPGVSYRKTFGSDAEGLDDDALANVSYNLTLKFGKF